MTVIFYRLLTPTTFANLDFSTLEEAERGLIEFGNKEFVTREQVFGT